MLLKYERGGTGVRNIKSKYKPIGSMMEEWMTWTQSPKSEMKERRNNKTGTELGK